MELQIVEVLMVSNVCIPQLRERAVYEMGVPLLGVMKMMAWEVMKCCR